VLLVHHLRQWQLPRILVKVTNAEQAEIVTLVGATEVIHPEQNSARKAALLIHQPRAVASLELGGGHLIVTAHPPASIVGKTVGTIALQERHGVALLGLWHAGQQGPPSPPAPDRTITETDVLILAGHIDRLRVLRRMQ
jgi:trk system potassium uptake protein TrkA